MDPLFNQAAADWARTTVMRMDPVAAHSFMTAVTHQLLVEDLAANARTLHSHVSEVHKALAGAAARAGLDPEQISKALGDDEYNRDRRGRFATVESRVRTNRNLKPLNHRGEQREGIPPVKGLSGAERSAYQQQYLALATAMDRAVGAGGKNVQAVLQHKGTGRHQVADISDLSHITTWDPTTHDIVAVRHQVPGTPAGAAGFDLVSALGQPAQRATQAGVETAERGMSPFAERWTNASGDNPGTNERTYRRVQAGSELLSDLTAHPALSGAPGARQAHVAAKFGEFVGQYGPEAEKVVGPHMRRTTYRYRGTERRPDPALIAARNAEVKRLEQPDADMSMAQIAARRMGASDVPAESKSQASAKAAISYLAGRLPTMRLAEIQRKSGRIPPSEGVIIDKDGKIAVQAVGFGEDHYLPFNLKNLGALRGGQYVRTRTTGGLTTEDIYTGLVSGARQVTVVSNSGVFTVTFADDFRGVRRYNDKAAAMVGRYAKTLDAIKGGQIEREPIDPAIKAELRDEVERDMPPSVFSRAEIDAAVKEKVDAFKAIPQLSTGELKLIEARARAGSKNEGDYKRTYAQLYDDALADRESRFYRLDGRGYAAAAESLREQFPYYISSVSFANRREALSPQGERSDENYQGVLPGKNGKLVPMSQADDKGYVKARHNRPDEALEGYYDPEIAGRGEIPGTGKTRASHTGYQNWEHNPVRRGAGKGVEAEPTESTPASPAKPKSSTDQLAEARRQVNADEERKAIVSRLLPATQSIKQDTYPALAKANADGLDAVWDDQTERERLLTELGQVATQYEGAGPQYADHARSLREGLSALKLVDSAHTGFAEHKPGQRHERPMDFDEPAYQASATPAMAKREWDRATAMVTSSLKTPLPSTLSDTLGAHDSQVANAAAALGRVSTLLGQGHTDLTAQTLVRVQNELGLPDSWVRGQYALITSPSADHTKLAESYRQASEGLERMRSLYANGIPAENLKESKAEPKGLAAQSSEPPAATKIGLTNPKSAVSWLRQTADVLDQEGHSRGDDYTDMADELEHGNFKAARKIAWTLSEDDPTRTKFLNQIFGEPDFGDD